jgi:CRISPR-associated exonuclease Cas4
MYYPEGYVWVTDVKDYIFCPAIAWIKAKIGYVEPQTPSMDVGKARVDAQFKLRIAEELNLPKPWRVEVYVRNPKLGLAGVIDLVAGEGRLVVAEIKAFKRRIQWSRHFRLQLALYALLAESLGRVRRAILYMGGDVYEVSVSSNLVEEAKRVLEEYMSLLNSEDPPNARQPEPKCRYCWYRRFCPSMP